MPKFIKDHSPEYDYIQVRNKTVYEVEGLDYDHWKTYDSKGNLKNKESYKIVIKIAKGFLILAGVFLIITIIASLIQNADGSDNIRRLIVFTGPSIPVSLIFAGITAGIGAFMEEHSEKKDVVDNKRQRSKTRILSDGCIAVLNEINGYVYQLTGPTLFSNPENNMQPAPFEYMEIIDNIHSVCVKKGYIVADADLTLYYFVHPYPAPDEYPNGREDDINLKAVVKYCSKRCRRKIKWDADMRGSDILMQACERLIRR